MNFKVVEKFVSINGEGTRAGQLAVFIRFATCNLSCSYCDTLWANQKDVAYEEMSKQDIYQYILSTKVTNITLTGGEPLLQSDSIELLKYLSRDAKLYIEIETNGSILLEPFIKIDRPPSFTMDYKLPSSEMEDKMKVENFKYLTQKDTVKFVVGSLLDLTRVKEIIDQFELVGRMSIYISPVFGKIDLETIVDFMKRNHLNGVTLQIQLHKVIWDANQKGV